MKANRFLGVSYDAPTDEDGTLTRYGWPGGYEVVYVFGDGEDICADCARRYLAERVEMFANGEVTASDIFGGTYYARSEVLTGHFTMADTDSCAHCEECGRYVLASGCMPETADGITEDDLYERYHLLRHALTDIGSPYPHAERIALLGALEDALSVSVKLFTDAPKIGLRHGSYCSYRTEEDA